MIPLRLIPHKGIRKHLWLQRVRREIGACGERVNLPMDGSYTLSRLFLGNDIHIGSHATMWAVHTRIVIGDKVVMGPGVTTMGSNHDMRLIGRFMKDLPESGSKSENDMDVVLETDIWVGTRAIILKGVRVGRGAVIGAGAIVTKSIPPYTIVGGNPARPIRSRGTVDQIMAHEQNLYPPEARLSAQQISDALA